MKAKKSQGKAKAVKPLSAKKPPEATNSHADIEAWIRRVMPDLSPIVKRLDELIRQTIPGLQYAVKWKKAYYGLPELGWVIEMARDSVDGVAARGCPLSNHGVEQVGVSDESGGRSPDGHGGLGRHLHGQRAARK
jgi:hypothetical protein